MSQTTFESFGIKKPKVKKVIIKKKLPKPKITVNTEPVRLGPEPDYDRLKDYKLSKLHLCYGSTTVYKYDNRIIGTGDLSYYEDPIMGKNLMVRDIFHNFRIMRKMITGSKWTYLSKSYDADIYEQKMSKKDIEKQLHQECSYGHKVYEITEDGQILDYPFIDIYTIKVEWES